MPATRRTRAESAAEQDELGESVVPDTQFTSTLRGEEHDWNSPGAATEPFSEEGDGGGGAQQTEELAEALTQREAAMAVEIAELQARVTTMQRNQARQA